MSQVITNHVAVAGLYYWSKDSTKEDRIANKFYPRYCYADIDTPNKEYANAVLEIFKKYNVTCIIQRVGKGFHAIGDFVDYDLWYKIRTETKPYCDPLWPPHCIRISRKRNDEVWEKPEYYQNNNNQKPNWCKAVLYFLCREMRFENEASLRTAMKRCGLDKYFVTTVYTVELKQ